MRNTFSSRGIEGLTQAPGYRLSFSFFPSFLGRGLKVGDLATMSLGCFLFMALIRLNEKIMLPGEIVLKFIPQKPLEYRKFSYWASNFLRYPIVYFIMVQGWDSNQR